MDEILVIEHKRAKAPEAEIGAEETLSRPTDPAPSSRAPLVDRENWASRFVPWLMSVTGGEWPSPPEAIPIGRRWRAEYFNCVADPQAFERDAEQEVQAYNVQEKL